MTVPEPKRKYLKTFRKSLINNSIYYTKDQNSCREAKLYSVSQSDNKIDVKEASPQQPILPLLSILGLIENAYLTWAKFTGAATLCSDSEACSSVLSSPYSSVPIVGIPLSFVAVIVYSLLLYLSLNTPSKYSLDNPILLKSNETAVLFLSTALVTFSAYLMTILHLVIKQSCLYCYTNTLISLSIGYVVWKSNFTSNNNNQKTNLSISTSSIFITSLLSGLLFLTTSLVNNPDVAYASTAPAALLTEEQIDRYSRNIPAPIKSQSSPKAVFLAQRLNRLGAKMYGAYWCSHCANQKETLGAEAMRMIPYIECDREGFNNQRDLCKERKVPGYPTWEIAGTLYPGEKEISEIEDIVKRVEKGL